LGRREVCSFWLIVPRVIRWDWKNIGRKSELDEDDDGDNSDDGDDGIEVQLMADVLLLERRHEVFIFSFHSLHTCLSGHDLIAPIIYNCPPWWWCFVSGGIKEVAWF
jgi:hypothetical protein